MCTIMTCLWTILCRRFMQKKARYSIPSHMTLNNQIPLEKRDYLKRTIHIGHCRRHCCMILIFIFEGFCENHRGLLSENYYFR